MSLKRGILALVATTMLLAGCGAPSTGSVGCPAQGWDAALLWSSETEPNSEVAFVRGDRVVGRQQLPYQGLEASPAEGIFRVADDAWLKSNGNTRRDKTHLLRYATDTCSTMAFPVREQVVRAVSFDRDAFTTTNTVNGHAEVRRRSLDGNLTAEARFPDITLSVLQPRGDRLYALGSTMGRTPDQALLLELDAVSLAEKRRLLLAGIAGSDALTITGDTLYYPHTVILNGPDHTEAEGNSLGAITLSDFRQSAVDLETAAPDLVVDAGDSLYIGHTFMNPGFRDTDEYRFVTRYTPTSGRVDTFDVGHGLVTMALSGDHLLVVTRTGRDTPRLTTYQLPAMTPLATVEVPQPTGTGYFYIAGLVTPPQTPTP